MTAQPRHPHHPCLVTWRARRTAGACELPSEAEDDMMKSPLAEQLRFVQERIDLMMALQDAASTEYTDPERPEIRIQHQQNRQ